MAFNRYKYKPQTSYPTGRVNKNPKVYPLIDSVAAACMAFHAAGDKIERYDNAAIPAGQFIMADGSTNKGTPATISNKTAAIAILDNSQVTQAARDEAALIIQSVQSQVTMSVLAGKNVSSFLKDLAGVMDTADTNGNIPAYRVGLLVYAPNVAHQAKEREERAEQIVECLYTSQPLGAVGAKVEVDFTMVEKRYLADYGCNAVFGKDDKGNLVSFLSKHDSLCKSGKIVGKIKSTGADKWHNNAIVTSLHYVKVAA